ncbi:type II toxin-antitoxin system RelE/ParE family toxin [Azospirillum largimobile]
MNYSVQFSPEAQSDLLDLYDHVAEQAGEARALAYLERIERHCMRLAIFPQRGTLREDVRSGLRIIGFERRVAVAFHVQGRMVTILRVLYGGRDLTGALALPVDEG